MGNKLNMSILSTLFVVVCSIPLIFGQRYVPPPGYERRYGAKDVNEWPSKKVYDEKTPRPTKWAPPTYEKPTPQPTKYVEDPDSYKGRMYSADEIYTELEKILLAQDPKAAIEEQLIIHGEEEGDDRLFSYKTPDGGRCTTPIFGFVNTRCSGGCCENGRCASKKKDWANVSYCPAECRGWPFAPQGTC